MFKNYFKVAYRNLVKYRAYTLTNIFGLAVGIAATILILVYILFEFSFDDFHENGSQIYRASIVHKKEGNIEYDSAVFTAPLGPALQREFPEVENFVRLSTPGVAYFSFDDHAFKVDGICHADSTIFDVFSFRLLSGNPKVALAAPYSIVLTKGTARRLFGSENPVGEILKVDNNDTYQVTGVVEDPPANSHIQYNALISFTTLYQNPQLFLDWNGGNRYTAYVKLRSATSVNRLEQRFPDFMWRHINEQYANYGLSLELYLQPLRDIHLYFSDDSKNTRANIYIFSSVALLILFIACVNFVNLTTARARKRAKEVGVRKTLGASRSNLVKQFLGESLLLALLALLLAALLVELFLPLYRDLLNKDLHLPGLANISYLATLVLILLSVGVAAGSYPAFYLSSFRVARTLKGKTDTGSGRNRSRHTLVVLQFVISICLIACTILVNHQLSFVKNRDLGFDRENMVVLPLIGDSVAKSGEILKTELLKLPDVTAVAASSDVPRDGFTSNGYIPEGFQNPILIHVLAVDADFLSTFDIEIVQGRNFSQEISTDRSAYLINETLAQTLNWDEPLGRTIQRNGDHRVIGVVKDFHFATLHDKIAPLILTNQPWHDQFSYLSLKLASADIAGTLESVRQTWQNVAPAAPCDYAFLDASFDQLYKSEERFQAIFLYFSILAIVIALLGILGLAAFATEQRTKEIGIRKVLGASVTGIVNLLSIEFLKPVVVAGLIAWPVAYFAMSQWLQDFAYRIDIVWWVFVLAGGLALLVALLTVSTQALRAAFANPVQSLRYE